MAFENITDNYDNTVELTDEDLIKDLKASIMLLVKDTDGDTAYDSMCDIITDLDVIRSRLENIPDLQELVNQYKRWWMESSKECESVKAELKELKEKIETLKAEDFQ